MVVKRYDPKCVNDNNMANFVKGTMKKVKIETENV